MDKERQELLEMALSKVYNELENLKEIEEWECPDCEENNNFDNISIESFIDENGKDARKDKKFLFNCYRCDYSAEFRVCIDFRFYKVV